MPGPYVASVKESRGHQLSAGPESSVKVERGGVERGVSSGPPHKGSGLGWVIAPCTDFFILKWHIMVHSSVLNLTFSSVINYCPLSTTSTNNICIVFFNAAKPTRTVNDFADSFDSKAASVRTATDGASPPTFRDVGCTVAIIAAPVHTSEL